MIVMNKESFAKALKEAKSNSKERKFKQSIDLIVNLKGLNPKKTEEQVDFFATIPLDLGKKQSICALVGPELFEEAKKVCDEVIVQDDFIKFAKDKKATKILARKHDFFIAQANIMPQIASAFGRALGPKGKMPNPKAGCIVPPKSNLKPLCDKLQKTLRISSKLQPIIQTSVGNEKMDEGEVIENAFSLYDQIIHHLPEEENNVKSVLIKLTMGKPAKVKA